VCNLYSITTNQAAIIALFRVINRYVGNLAPMPGVFPDYKAPIVRNGPGGRELATARWGMPSPLGLTVESVSRAISRLRRAGAVNFAGGPNREIKIVDRQHLRSLHLQA
jgi:putative SOS response-associated peptidase YedK